MNNADSTRSGLCIHLEALLDLFYTTDQAPGIFAKVDRSSVPDLPAKLLAHDHHMTVTLESYHGCHVDLEVLGSRVDGDHYSRKILLKRQSDAAVVMFGIVRLNRTMLAESVRTEIEKQATPLGRILINCHVLRVVKLVDLYEIHAANDLAATLGIDDGSLVYGRTAMIYCDGEPAIELLEIAKA